MWDKLEAIERGLSTIDKSVTELSGKLDRSADRLNDHDSKIRSLELKVYGIAAGLIGAITILVTGIIK